MKKLFCAMVLLIGMLLAKTECYAGMVAGGVWYDEQEMAIAIDLNHSAWQFFNRMELDFNADRDWGQIIDGSEKVTIDNQLVRRFEFGVYRNFQYPDGRKVRYFGWSHNPLFDNEGFPNWTVFIDKLYYGEKSPEVFQCYAPDWNPLGAQKTVFCQTIDVSGNAVPVFEDDLDHIFVRYENGDWTPLATLTAPVPPLSLDMRITPAVLSRNSKGQHITAIITLPDDLELDETEMDMSLHFEVINSADNSVEEVHLQSLRWDKPDKYIKNGIKHLTIKLPRQKFNSLPRGESTITVTGQIDCDHHLKAEGTIHIR